MKALNYLLLTTSLIATSVGSAFSQNKSDMKLSKELTASSTYKTDITQQEDGSYKINYHAFNSDENSHTNLNMVAVEKKKDGIITPDEVIEVAYAYNKGLTSKNVDAKKQPDGTFEVNWFVENPVAEASDTEKAKDLNGVRLVNTVLPGLNKGPK